MDKGDIVTMAKRVKIVLTIILSIVTTLLLGTTVYRWTWDYNENGAHFDPETAMTYNDGAIIGYGLLSILFFIPTVALIVNLKER